MLTPQIFLLKDGGEAARLPTRRSTSRASRLPAFGSPIGGLSIAQHLAERKALPEQPPAVLGDNSEFRLDFLLLLSSRRCGYAQTTFLLKANSSRRRDYPIDSTQGT